ncbi:discoidin domain-containing protein [Frigoribacterium salinisoli]
MPSRTRPVPPPLLRALVGITAAAVVATGVVPAAAAAPGDPATPAPVAAAPSADGVALGAGSYAPTPPSTIASYADVRATLDKPLFIDPSRAGEPVPTNQWWTDLVVSRFSGDLWANPFVASNSAAGTELSYPKDWNAEGTAMRLTQSLTVSGQVTPAPAPGSTVLADFEDGLPDGWTATGTAFATTASGTARGQSAVSGWLGDGFANSFTDDAGDGATGTLTSPAFTVDTAAIAALVGGGAHPGQEALELLVDGEVVRSATGENSEQLRWVTWDVAELAGRTAQLRVVDQLTAGWAHVLVDQVVATDDATDLAAQWTTDFRADRADALRWGDWNVSWRMPQVGAGGQHMDVTLAQGQPYTWFEFDGMAPRLTLAPGAVVTDAAGDRLAFPVTTDRFRVDQGGHVFGVHAPAGTTFTRSGDVLQAAEGTPHLVVSAVPDAGLTLDELHRTAFAVPRGTRMDHRWDQEAGTVVQDWSVDAEPLEGTGRDTVQGWLKHQYGQATRADLDLGEATYETPRGTMRTSVGHDGWRLEYDFAGFAPIGGAPGADVLDDEQRAIVQRYVREYAARTTYGGDTYWGGKDLQQLAQYLLVARQIGDEASRATLTESLTAALTDWYTYTEGEREHFFAMYPTWGALVGFGDSYGSAQFNDAHFHHGYFAVATAVLGAEDPEWLARYGDVATLVNKQYANADRDDDRFPYLRTSSVWEGHSNAGGFSSPGGNNQESSSEAIQAAAGSFLLGTVLGDERMQAAGAMQYVTERAAVLEYYQDASGNPASASYDGDGAFPEAYGHAQAGILYDSGQAYATYFSGDPAWIYGIQWMPTAPWFSYFGRDPGLSRAIMAQMMAERPEVVGQEGTAGANVGRVQMVTKRWYGVGSYGDVQITQDEPAAIREIQEAVRAVERHHPGYVTQRTAANPFWDAATDTLYVSVDDRGGVVFDDRWWTPETLPASLVPARLTGAEADRLPQDWPVPSPLLGFLSTDYRADPEAIAELYGVDLTDYEPGRDTAHAARVFSEMGDALGNVVLGFLAQYDPEVYADVHAALWAAQDPTVTGTSMAGLVHWQALSNRGLGPVVDDRRVVAPFSQVHRDADGRWSYVVANPSDEQRSFEVREGDRVVGSIAVPARTQITSHLDAELTRVDVTAEGSPTTLAPGSTTTFTAVGHDQYGATVPLDGLRWGTTTGTIDADGRLTTTARTPTATVTATLGGVSASYDFRVAPAPVLTGLAVEPGSAQLVVDEPRTYAAAGRDQYGDPIALADAVAWSYTGPGTISADGVLVTTGPGAGHVVATSAGVEGSAVASSVGELPDAALRATVTATSGQGSAARAVDGDPTTRWESEHGVDEVDLTVDLGRATDVASVGVRWEAAAARRWQLQVADRAEGPWRTVRTVEKADASADRVAVGETARLVRVHATDRLTQYGHSIWDLTVSGTPAATAITPSTVLVGPRAAAVTTGGTVRLAAHAYDGDGHGGAARASWSLEGDGRIADDGTYTAPAVPGTATVTATVGDVTGTSTITVLADGTTEVEPVGGLRDVARGKRVTTSSQERGDLGGGQAVDGDRGTRWASARSDDEWIAVDLGSVLPLDAVELDWEGAYADAYRVQVRDAATDPWRTVATETAGRGGVERHELSDVAGRYVRMLGTARHTGWGYSLHELRVLSREGAPTPDLARTAAVTASSEESGTFAPTRATDGDPGTRWASRRGSDDEWLQLDLGRPTAVQEATLTWEGAHARSYRIEARNDADDPWTTLAARTAATGGTEVLPVAGEWRYVRFRGVERATPWGYSLYGVELR